MLESIHKLFKALHENNILYCHWKSNEHLEPALNGDTDLDMLFCPEDRGKIDILLNECGLKRFRSTPFSQYNAIEDFIGFDKAEAKIWHLHLHYRLTLGENHLKGYTLNTWGEYLLKNRILHETGVYTTCPEDELILLCVRIALKYTLHSYFSKLNKDDVREFFWLKEKANISVLIVHADFLIGGKCTKILLSLLGSDLKRKKQFSTLNGLLKKQLQCFTGNSFFAAWLKREIRTVYWLIGGANHRLNLNASSPYSRVSPSGGCAIAIIGSDGAGKSTTIKYLRNEFSKKLDVKTVYLGSGDGSSSLLRKPMKFVAQKVGGKGLGTAVEKEYKDAETDTKKHISIKARLYSLAKILWAIALAIEKKSKAREITKARNNGMIVLLDRYPQCKVFGCNDGPLLHQYVESENWISKNLAKWEQKIYEMFDDNPPDLTVKLIVNEDIALQRKPEMTKDEIRKKIETVLEMNPSKSVVIVDTSVDKIISFGKIMEAIWKIV